MKGELQECDDLTDLEASAALRGRFQGVTP
jgi:hypothetical protein